MTTDFDKGVLYAAALLYRLKVYEQAAVTLLAESGIDRSVRIPEHDRKEINKLIKEWPEYFR